MRASVSRCRHFSFLHRFVYSPIYTRLLFISVCDAWAETHLFTKKNSFQNRRRSLTRSFLRSSSVRTCTSLNTVAELLSEAAALAYHFYHASKRCSLFPNAFPYMARSLLSSVEMILLLALAPHSAAHCH